MRFSFFILILFLIAGCNKNNEYDIIIRNGNIYNGSGSKSFISDIAIKNDSIAFIGDLSNAEAETEIDASGLAVSPGFINMLSWANVSLIHDGRSQSDIRQGVTLEVMGEGWSMGPWNDKMKEEEKELQGDIKFDIGWTTLGEYLEHLERKGVSCNVASFVGAGTVRINVLGYEDRAPDKDELEQMKKLVANAMEEGALGVGSSLIYAPDFYSDTDELIELCRTASEYGGIYISHIRSEGNKLLEAADELIRISKEANIPAEFYHLKAAGESNWNKLDSLIAKINKAREEGLKITANIYTYTAGATGLDAAMPPWVQEGGFKEWKKNLQDPQIRNKVMKEMVTPTDEWENFFIASGGPENIVLVGFKTDTLKYLTGKTLKEIADIRGKSPEETAIDLVIDDDSRVVTVYFLMSEENIVKKIKIP